MKNLSFLQRCLRINWGKRKVYVIVHNLEQAVMRKVSLGCGVLPLAQALPKNFNIIGFDTESDKVGKLDQEAIELNPFDS